MSDSNSMWPFQEISAEEGLDINEIFGTGTSNGAAAPEANPFQVPQQAVPAPEAATPHVEQPPTSPAAPQAEQTPAPQPTAVTIPPATIPAEEPAPSNPLEAAFEAKTVENAKASLFEKKPVFCHKSAKEIIEDPTMTFEELRIRKSEDFLDLEEGKNVSWSVEYGTIRKDVKDPKGTTIISMKESIERSREFLDALKKAKDKNPDCIVRPKVTMKNKGTATYKGTFPTVEAARNSDKVICLIPGNDGHIYEMHKTEQGEFIAPKHKIIDFQAVAAGFTPALPLIPLSLMRQIIAFFRSFMAEHGQEYEALVLIYWDKWKEEYLAYVPKQNVSKAGIHASLQENPYDDESRYIHYADIHSHNSMEAFFSSIDDADERGTGIYMVLGHLDHFYPEIAARICCGGSFVDIDPGTVVEGLEEPFPPEWCIEVSHEKAPVSRVSPRKAEKTGIWGWKALDLLLGDLK